MTSPVPSPTPKISTTAGGSHAILALFFFYLAAGVFIPCLRAEGDHRASGRVLFFSEPNFRGEVLAVDAGADITNLAQLRDSRGRKWDDRIASFSIEGDAKAVLFADPRFRGERAEFRRSVADLSRIPRSESGLESWDHSVSALKVEEGYSRHEPEQRMVEILKPEPQYRSQREADRAIREAFLDLLGREPDFEGLQNYRRRLLDEYWDEERLRHALRESDEFRHRDFEGIIRRVYRQEIGRDPQPETVSNYSRQLRDRGWSESELRHELSNSKEARRQRAEVIVDRAYRDILGREPDQDGFRNYVNRMVDGASESWVRNQLRNSDEGRKRKH